MKVKTSRKATRIEREKKFGFQQANRQAPHFLKPSKEEKSFHTTRYFESMPIMPILSLLPRKDELYMNRFMRRKYKIPINVN